MAAVLVLIAQLCRLSPSCRVRLMPLQLVCYQLLSVVKKPPNSPIPVG